MPDGVLFPEVNTFAEGYTLGQSIERVRQALRTRRNFFSAPITGPQGYTAADLISRVRNGLRDDDPTDANRFIKDNELLAWLNEGIIDLADKTHSVHASVNDVTNGTALIPLPPDFLGMGELYIAGSPVNQTDDDEEWNDFAYSGASPSQPMCRINGPNVEFYPNVGDGTTYELHYIATPYTFVSKNDPTLTNLPKTLQIRAVFYARANAYWRLRDYFEGDRYMGMYTAGLGAGESDRPAEADMAKPREVQDYEIIAWLNEAWLQLAFREEFLRREVIAPTSGGLIELPGDFLKVQKLRLSDRGFVEFVNDDTYDSWAFGSPDSMPGNTLGRVFGASIELYPSPAAGITYTLRYIGKPRVVTDLTHQPEVPVVLQERAIQYARAQALLSAPIDANDVQRSDRYMAAFEQGLKKGTVNERIMPGPMNLVPIPGYWDRDPEAMHL